MTKLRLLPEADTLEAYKAVHRDEIHLRPGVQAILQRHALTALPVRRFPDGSLPVYAIGESLVLKLYPPFELAERDNESTVLQSLDKRLPIPTPGVEVVGELEGWGYLVMRRLHGRVLAGIWPEIPPGDQMKLADALGEALARLHSVRRPELDRVRIDWGLFVDGQRRTCVERQRARGLGEPWLEQIPDFLASVKLDSTPPDALLHTEVMREHLLVRRTARGWRLSGLLDFEPAMIGDTDYEFAAVGLFVSCGDAVVLRRILLAYGLAEEALTPELSRRFMAYALLHRYSNIAWYLKLLSPAPEVRTLSGLAEEWFGTAPRLGGR